jgi:hypothetical protein
MTEKSIRSGWTWISRSFASPLRPDEQITFNAPPPAYPVEAGVVEDRNERALLFIVDQTSEDPTFLRDLGILGRDSRPRLVCAATAAQSSAQSSSTLPSIPFPRWPATILPQIVFSTGPMQGSRSE